MLHKLGNSASIGTGDSTAAVRRFVLVKDRSGSEFARVLGLRPGTESNMCRMRCRRAMRGSERQSSPTQAADRGD